MLQVREKVLVGKTFVERDVEVGKLMNAGALVKGRIRNGFLRGVLSIHAGCLAHVRLLVRKGLPEDGIWSVAQAAERRVFTATAGALTSAGIQGVTLSCMLV